MFGLICEELVEVVYNKWVRVRISLAGRRYAAYWTLLGGILVHRTVLVRLKVNGASVVSAISTSDQLTIMHQYQYNTHMEHVCRSHHIAEKSLWKTHQH